MDDLKIEAADETEKSFLGVRGSGVSSHHLTWNNHANQLEEIKRYEDCLS